MVDQWTGTWEEEKYYTTYPKEKWCMYDFLANEIRKSKYQVKTTMEHLITIILLSVDSAIENEEKLDKNNPDDIMRWVDEQGGLKEFDYTT